MTPWPLVPLSEVLKERRETPITNPTGNSQIRIISKIGFEDGRIELRSGLETRTAMVLIRPGDLVISGINATKGAIAIYDEDNSEPIAATIHYGGYIPDRTRVDPRFLWWLLRSKTFRDLLEKYVPGGIKTELKATRLLPIPVPLPDLPEQQRIIERIERRQDLIRKARRVHEELFRATEQLVISIHLKLAGQRTRKLAEIMQLAEDRVPVSPTGTYPQVGVKGFGAGLFAKSATSGSDTTYKSFNRLYAGAIVLSQVKGWEGAIAVCTDDFSGWFASPEYRTFRCLPNEAHAQYLSTLFRTEWLWSRFGRASRGVGARRQRTRPDQFLSLEIPMPTVDQQAKTFGVFSQIEQFRQVHAETEDQYHTMLSSIIDNIFDEMSK